MVERLAGPQVSIGFASETGPRHRNEDFAGAAIGAELPQPRPEIIAAIADGVGGAKGGRVASEIAVRGFLDGYWDAGETLSVRKAGAQVVTALNTWINALGRRDPELAGMACTFTAIVLRGRVAHVLHAGDSRAYRLAGGRLTRLTVDHVRRGPEPALLRGLGIDAEIRLDYLDQPMGPHDRFLLCSDGLHGVLDDARIAQILNRRAAPAETARALVEAALAAGSSDNCTALMLDITGLPAAESVDLGGAIARLPLIDTPQVGQTIDGFALQALLSDGRYSRLFGAIDEAEGGDVALKFPKPPVADAATLRAAFLREAWVGARVQSPWVARVLEPSPGRQSCLYTVMPLYVGELLEARLARRPAIGLEEGRNIAVKLARAAAALHRVDIVHRDIKPDNVMLEAEGSLKLLDLGVVRAPGIEEFPPEDIPGTRAFMAPEMFAGEAGNAATDLYALGITMFRAFTGAFPYGNLDATSGPRQQKPIELTGLRPDLPAWLQSAIGKAIAADPAQRHADMIEFAHEMEAGPARPVPVARRPKTLYERNPLVFWQVVSALLALGLLFSFLRH